MSIKNEKRLIIFVVLYFVVESLNIFVKLHLNGLPMWGVITKGILLVALIPAICVLLSRNGTLLLLEILLIILLSFTFLFGMCSDSYLVNGIYVTGIYLPIGCCVGCIRNKKKLLSCLYKISIVPTVLLYVTLLSFTDGLYNYSMSASYSLLFWGLVISDHFFNVKKTMYDLVLIFFDLVIIVFRGSRGALLCFFAFFAFTILMKQKEFTRKKAGLILMSLGAVSVFVLCYMLGVFKLLYQFLLGQGYQSRVLWTLANDIFYNSGRTPIYQEYLSKISDRWLYGYGLFGGIQSGMAVPHNCILEAMLYFGVPIGSLVIVVLAIGIITCIRRKRNVENSRVLIIVLSVLVSTLFSNELFLSPFFYIGLIMIIRDKYVSYDSSKENNSLINSSNETRKKSNESTSLMSGLFLY